MTSFTIPTLQTDRLTLRAPKMADLDRFTAFFASDRSHIIGGPRNARESYRSMMATFGSWALQGHGLWHIADRETDTFLGWTGILFAPGWAEPELGWTVTEDAEGKGIAFEAAQAARTHAAREQGKDGVISYIDPANTRSAALAERLGARFEREGELMGHACHIYRHPKEGAA